jgi:hypothetical protein
MLSKIIFALAAASVALAAPGGYEPDCYTTCYTELCTESTVYQKTTQYYSTKTIWQPVTNYVPSTYAYTKTYPGSKTSWIVTSTPVTYTTVIYKPVTYNTVVPEPSTSVCTEVTTVPVVTSSAYASVCTEESVYPYTAAWVETQTTCSTVYPSPTYGNNNGW